MFFAWFIEVRVMLDMTALQLSPMTCAFSPWDDTDAVPFIEFRHVSKKFGEFIAVDDLSLKIYKREFFALLGPSGCGKTTIMRMLAGFERPDRGDIFLDGVNVSETPPYRLPVNMMFQSYALFPHMTVEKNIAFGLRQDGLAKPDIARRVEEMLALVKLEPFAKRKPHQLSGGQRQRVALARSLAKRPKALLLDEPLGALDRKLREQTQFELMDLQEKLGMTFIIVTHDQEEAMTVASRIAVMDHGRIVQIAPPAEIYEQPNSRYVASFIGDINLFEGHITSLNAHQIDFLTASGRVRVHQESETFLGKTLGKDKAWFAIRPEKVHISLDPPDGKNVNAVEGTVWDIAYLGDVSVYHVKLANGNLIKATTTNATRLKRRPINWEDHVWLTWGCDGGIILPD